MRSGARREERRDSEAESVPVAIDIASYRSRLVSAKELHWDCTSPRFSQPRSSFA